MHVVLSNCLISSLGLSGERMQNVMVLKNYTSGSGMMTLYLSVRLTLIYIQMFIGTLLCALLHFCHMVTIETTQGEILQ